MRFAASLHAGVLQRVSLHLCAGSRLPVITPAGSPAISLTHIPVPTGWACWSTAHTGPFLQLVWCNIVPPWCCMGLLVGDSTCLCAVRCLPAVPSSWLSPALPEALGTRLP